MRNHTVTTFILLGLTEDPQIQSLLLIFLLFTYLLNITGNLAIILLTLIDPHLKTPMYFFLQNFSFLEILFTSACIPRYLYNLATGDKTITYGACASQAFFTDLFGVTEFFSPGYHVLRPLCGHLQTSALHHHHEHCLQKTPSLLLDGWGNHHIATL